MSQTVRHGLPLLEAGQAQKEITHNEALSTIDMRLHLSVLSRSVSTPPGAPEMGAAYIVPSGATGGWAGADGQIAMHDGFGWRFDAPVAGTVAWIADEAGCVLWDGEWSVGWPVNSLRVGTRNVLSVPPVEVTLSTGGAMVDMEARAAIAELLSALRGQGLIS